MQVGSNSKQCDSTDGDSMITNRGTKGTTGKRIAPKKKKPDGGGATGTINILPGAAVPGGGGKITKHASANGKKLAKKKAKCREKASMATKVSKCRWWAGKVPKKPNGTGHGRKGSQRYTNYTLPKSTKNTRKL